jgi:very-short-patch-repair endonuclease
MGFLLEMNLLERAKTLRQQQTDAELRLWYRLRAHRFMGLKFKRQMPMGRYIVDFVCHECKLIIELDGGQHQENVGYDQARDAWLRGQGYVVLRFWNHDVLQQMESVLEAIRLAVLDALSPGPSPASGRGEPSMPARDHPSPARGRGAGGEGDA